jgi:hypothetical protein
MARDTAAFQTSGTKEVRLAAQWSANPVSMDQFRKIDAAQVAISNAARMRR